MCFHPIEQDYILKITTGYNMPQILVDDKNECRKTYLEGLSEIQDQIMAAYPKMGITLGEIMVETVVETSGHELEIYEMLWTI